MKRETLDNCIINTLDIASLKIFFIALLFFAAIFTSVYVLCSEGSVKPELKYKQEPILVHDTKRKGKDNCSIINLMV